MKSVFVKVMGGLLSIILLFFALVMAYQQDPLPPLINSLILEKHITQVSDNLSGLTWDRHTNTLLAVTNRPAQLIQLDKNGNMINRLPLPNIDDPESISLGWEHRYLIAEERQRKITPITLSLTNRHYKIYPALSIDVGGEKNEGLEGVAFSKSSGSLFVANEKKPAVIFKIDGFNTPDLPLRIKKIYSSSDDISGLAWSDSRQRLYVLSDEAKSLIEMDSTGKVFRASILSDFAHEIPQPEGVAIHDNIIYIVSEPNYFYAFAIAN